VAILNSVFPFPMDISRGLPMGLLINKRPDGKFELARRLRPGHAQEGEFEILHTCDTYRDAENWAIEQLKKGDLKLY